VAFHPRVYIDMARKNLVLSGFILLKFLLQYVLLSPEYELQRDEYLYLDQARHLAWGYASVPPFTSWISLVIGFLGNSVFWVKFFPAFFGALTMLLVWKAIEALKGDLFALILGASCILFSALLRLNTLYQPNSFDILSWTALYFATLKYFQTENPKWLFLAALAFALGFLNKYNIAFLLVGLVPAILLSRHRRVLARKDFYLALGMVVLLVAPNLIWQYTNGFPVIHHMEVLVHTQLVHNDSLEFIKLQFLFFIGSVFVIAAALYSLLFYSHFEKYKPFFWTFFLTLVVFIYFKAKAYYAIGLYPIYLAFGSVFISHVLRHGWKRHMRPVAVAIPVLFFIPLYNLIFPNKSPEYIRNHAASYKALGLLRWEDGKDHELPQDFADMLGWKELATKVDKVYAGLPNPDKTLVLCDNYGQAGAINYYSKEGIQAVSFNADYIHWFDLERPYLNLIRVKTREERNDEFRKTSPYFEEARIFDSITNRFAREYGTTIFTFTGARIDVNKRIRQEINSRLNSD